MNKKILIALLAGILAIDSTQASFKVDANYSREFTGKFAQILAKRKIGQWALRSWALSMSTAPLWALPATIIYSGVQNQLLQQVLPESVAQYVCFYDKETIKQEFDQETTEKLAKLSEEHKSQLLLTQVQTALFTTAALGSLWLANKYKDKFTQLFKAKTSINTIMQQAKNIAQAVQELKANGYTKLDFIKAKISSSKFSATDLNNIAKQLS